MVISKSFWQTMLPFLFLVVLGSDVLAQNDPDPFAGLTEKFYFGDGEETARSVLAIDNNTVMVLIDQGGKPAVLNLESNGDMRSWRHILSAQGHTYSKMRRTSDGYVFTCYSYEKQSWVITRAFGYDVTDGVLVEPVDVPLDTVSAIFPVPETDGAEYYLAGWFYDRNGTAQTSLVKYDFWGDSTIWVHTPQILSEGSRAVAVEQRDNSLYFLSNSATRSRATLQRVETNHGYMGPYSTLTAGGYTCMTVGPEKIYLAAGRRIDGWRRSSLIGGWIRPRGPQNLQIMAIKSTDDNGGCIVAGYYTDPWGSRRGYVGAFVSYDYYYEQMIITPADHEAFYGIATLPDGCHVAVGSSENRYGNSDSQAWIAEFCSTGFPTALETFEEPQIVKAYPNPTQGKLTLETPKDGSYELLNALGQKIGGQNTVKGPNKLDLSRLPAGVYFLRITQGEDITVEKIVKR